MSSPNPFAPVDAALSAHARLSSLPTRRLNPLGMDRVAMEQAGIRFRPTDTPVLRERVMQAAISLGGVATINALAQATGMERHAVKHAVEGMIERGLMARGEKIARDDGHGGVQMLFRVAAASPWDV
jgi:hypothetical protein